jgi:hypothetical protein
MVTKTNGVSAEVNGSKVASIVAVQEIHAQGNGLVQ